MPDNPVLHPANDRNSGTAPRENAHNNYYQRQDVVFYLVGICRAQRGGLLGACHISVSKASLGLFT